VEELLLNYTTLPVYKIRTLFSRNVIPGQVYNASFGDALPKGIYVYNISNGKQKYSGKIIKLE
jgi:hypothetical protein